MPPFGIKNDVPRLTIITRVCSGNLKLASVSPPASISGVTSISTIADFISSGSSTPKAVASSGVLSSTPKSRAIVVTVIPCTTSESIVIKNTMLNIVCACETSYVKRYVAKTIGTAPRKPTHET